MIKSVLGKIVYNKHIRSCAKIICHWFPSLAVKYSYLWEQRVVYRKAMQALNSGNPLPEGASREDYLKVFNAQKISWIEYYGCYRFYNKEKTEAEKKEFLSKLQINALSMKLRMMFPEYDNKPMFDNKEKFLAHITSLGMCQRRWLYAPDASLEEFSDMVRTMDCIVKPHDESCGEGVFKVDKQQGPQVKELYEKCIADKMLVEECMRNCDEVRAFHPASLNTLRVVTVAYGGKAQIVAAVIRMGRGGSVIDNAMAGGFYANVDIETGIINTDGIKSGITSEGYSITVHPDSGIHIKGFQLPRWPDLVEFVLSAARQSKSILTGWDVVLTDKGNFEFVEANSRPDPVLIQAPLQRGMRTRLLNMLSEMTGRRITL